VAIVVEFQRVEAALVLHLVERTDALERVSAFGQKLAAEDIVSALVP
jgi:hypothetical protein